MFETSLDVFYLTLSVCIAVLTFFLCWALYYFIRLGRDAVYTVEKFTSVLRKLDEVLDTVKEKLHNSGTYIALAANAVKSVVEYLGEKKQTRRAKK
ncbi:MAG: hypothetical protein HY461_03230 [Parcubacteria group bacterium]|nr:hypothetical protein [Parcubacteria group bacterium]